MKVPFPSVCVGIEKYSCPEKFRRLATGCYRYQETTISWTEAKERCSKWEAKMVVVNSKREQNVITKLTKKLVERKVRFWLDGQNTQNGWKINGKTSKPKYAPWGATATASKGSCLRTGPETKWYSARCKEKVLPGGFKMSPLCIVRCPKPWREMSTGCYWIPTTKSPMIWEEAQAICSSVGAKMLDPSNKEERTEIVKQNGKLIKDRFRFWLNKLNGECYRTGPDDKRHKVSCQKNSAAGGYTFNPLCKIDL